MVSSVSEAATELEPKIGIRYLKSGSRGGHRDYDTLRIKGVVGVRSDNEAETYTTSENPVGLSIHTNEPQKAVSPLSQSAMSDCLYYTLENSHRPSSTVFSGLLRSAVGFVTSKDFSDTALPTWKVKKACLLASLKSSKDPTAHWDPTASAMDPEVGLSCQVTGHLRYMRMELKGFTCEHDATFSLADRIDTIQRELPSTKIPRRPILVLYTSTVTSTSRGDKTPDGEVITPVKYTKTQTPTQTPTQMKTQMKTQNHKVQYLHKAELVVGLISEGKLVSERYTIFESGTAS